MKKDGILIVASRSGLVDEQVRLFGRFARVKRLRHNGYMRLNLRSCVILKVEVTSMARRRVLNPKVKPALDRLKVETARELGLDDDIETRGYANMTDP